MKALKLALVVALAASGVAAGAAPAAAEEPTDARMARLEALLVQQATELDRMRVELDSLRETENPVERRLASPVASPADPPAAAPLPRRPTPTSPPPGQGAPTAAPPPTPTAQDLQSSVDTALAGTPAARRSYAGQIGGVRWGGYLTLEYLQPSWRNSTFDLHRLVFQFDAPLTDRIALTGELEYEHGGIGGGAEGDVEVEYCEVNFQVADWFNPKLGAILIPFGRFNLFHDDPLNDFTRRPWVARYFVPSGFGQPGIGADGAFGLGCRGALTYNIALTNGFGGDITTADGVRPARQKWQADNNENKTVWGRLAAVLDVPGFDHLSVGLSGMGGKWDDDGDHWMSGFGADLTFQKGPFEFHGEYIQYDIRRAAGAPIEDPRKQWGMYAELGYHFFPSLMCCLRGSTFVRNASHFTLALRYQQMDLNDALTGGSFNDDLKGYGVALNYRIQEGTVFRVDTTWFDAAHDDDRTEFTASFSTYF